MGVSGKFLSVNGKVVAPVEGGGNAETFKGVDDGGDILVKLDFPGIFSLDKGKLPASHVGVYCAAARKTAGDGYAVFLCIGQVYFLGDVLIFPHHKGRGGAPKEENRIAEILLLGKIVFDGEIIKNVAGICLNINHLRPPKPPMPYRSFGQGAPRQHGEIPFQGRFFYNGQNPRESHNA